MRSKDEVLAWEERWSRPAGIAALVAIVFVIASIVVASKVGGGDGDSELLRNVDAHSGSQILSSILQGIGVALLALPLYVLFTAARNRSDRVRGQLVGVVVAGPLFLAVAAVLIGVTTVDAAGDFVTNVVPELVKEGNGAGKRRRRRKGDGHDHRVLAARPRGRLRDRRPDRPRDRLRLHRRCGRCGPAC